MTYALGAIAGGVLGAIAGGVLDLSRVGPNELEATRRRQGRGHGCTRRAEPAQVAPLRLLKEMKRGTARLYSS